MKLANPQTGVGRVAMWPTGLPDSITLTAAGFSYSVNEGRAILVFPPAAVLESPGAVYFFSPEAGSIQATLAKPAGMDVRFDSAAGAKLRQGRYDERPIGKHSEDILRWHGSKSFRNTKLKAN